MGTIILCFCLQDNKQQQFVCVLKPQEDRLRLSRSVCSLQALPELLMTRCCRDMADKQCRLIQLPGRRYEGKERKGKEEIFRGKALRGKERPV